MVVAIRADLAQEKTSSYISDILLLTPGFACADPVWSSACVWPQTTQANPVDIKHMKPEELNEYETILNTVKLIHVACFNEEVFEIIHNIKTDDARDLVVAFYFNKNINPKDAIAFTKLPEFEIPCSETDKNEKTDGPSIDTLTGGHSAIPDYKTNNDDKIQLNNPQNIYGESEIDRNKNADGQSINTVTGGHFIAPDHKTDNNDEIQMNNPQNIYGENYKKIPSDQSIVPYEILSYPLPEKQIAANLPISYEPKLNQLTPTVFQIKHEHMNPKAPIAFTELPEYEIPCNDTAENNKAEGPSIDTLTGDLLGTSDYKTDNNQRIQLNYPENAYAVNNNGIPSTRNNIPNEVMSNSLPGEVIAVNPPISYQPKLNLPAPNILQLNNKDINPKATIELTKLPVYEIPCSEIGGNEKADGQSINTVTGGHFIAPDYKTDNNDGIQLKNPQNIYGENYKKIPSDQNIVPYEILPYLLPEKQITANLPISYESKLNQLTPNVFQIKHEHINPKAPIAFTEISEYEIPCSETAENKKAEGPSIDTLTGDLLGTPDYNTDNNQRIQLNYPENAYAVNNNRIPSTRNNIPSEVMSNSLPGEAIAVNPPISFQSKLNLPAPNILQLNNKDNNLTSTTALSKLPDYKIPCSVINESVKANKQGLNTLIGDLPVAPNNKLDNYDRIQLNNPQISQNLYALNNNKIPSTQNNLPFEALYSLPEKLIEVVENQNINPLTNYESKLNIPTPTTDVKMLHLNNDPKATLTFEIPNSQMDEKENPNIQSIDSLTDSGLAMPYYKTDDSGRIQSMK
ncbi:hypothetical protein MSG28_016172 [Choristoneura fumiferana]|uniref:Uncharacterized protein n=1 Tax=Choristoneura fumiferana TaxID=7141 RepID=A0ACC0K5J3_CHOFU|nr:hypothetical protein MSG28_016172 [Choristoneura fumiferana]